MVLASAGKVCHDSSLYQVTLALGSGYTAFSSLLTPKGGNAFLLLLIHGQFNFPYFISQLSYHLCNQFPALNSFCSKFSYGFYFLIVHDSLIVQDGTS